VASLALLTVVTPARASVMSITPAGLAGATLIDLGPTQTNAPIDGQTISRVQFSFLISGVHSPLATIDDGPGNTNNITVANVVSINGTNTNAELSMHFPTPQTRMGYGYAILSTATVPNATTVQLFDSANNLVGTLSANGMPDPVFTGGFLRVKSDIPFVRADVTFASAPACTFDNLRFQFIGSDVIPEPTSLKLFSLCRLGLAG
jgi:hypothetical protein